MDQEQQYPLDSIILVKTKDNMDQPGKVRFYGEVVGTKGIWYGIELFEPKGRHNGFVKGKQYFVCKESHGIFLREKSLAVYEGDIIVDMEKQDSSKENITEIQNQDEQEEQKQDIPAKIIPQELESKEQYIQIIEQLNSRVIELEQELQNYRQKSTKQERNQENSTEVLENYRKQIYNLELQLKKSIEKQKQLEQTYEDQSANSKLIEQLTLKNEDLSITNELQMYELDDANTQIQQLKDELQQFAISINNTVESRGDDVVISDNATMDQLINDNQKLKYALQLLNDKYVAQKQEHERQTETFSLALAKVPELQEKLQHLEQMQLELQEKEAENEELKAQIDQNSEATMMIELMSTEIMKKDSELVELKRSIKDFKEEQYVDGQLIDEYDVQLKEIQQVLIQKDFEISQKEGMVLEMNQKLQVEAKLVEKIKEKLESTTSQLNYMQEMQKDSSSEKEQLQKIDQLFFKQYEVNEEKRELAKQLIIYSVQNIELKNESMVTELYFKTLPKELLTSLQLDQFRRYLTTKEIHQKCIFIFKTLVTQYLEKKSLIKDQFELIQWCFKFLTQIINLYYHSLFLDNLFINSDLDQYSKLCRSDMYTAIVGANSYLASIINHMKEDALSSDMSIELLERINSKLHDAEDNYQDKIEEEFKKFIMFQRDLMRVVIMVQGVYLGVVKIESEREVFVNCFQKFKVTLEKVLSLQINEFQILDFNLHPLIDKLQSLYNLLQTKQSLDSTDNDQITELESYISSQIMTNQLIQLISNKNIKPIQEKKGPWNTIVQGAQQELIQILENKEKLNKIDDELKEQMKFNISKEKRIKELENVKSIQEQKLAELILKGERVTILENEKKQFQAKEEKSKQTSQFMQNKLQEFYQKTKDLEADLEKEKKKNQTNNQVQQQNSLNPEQYGTNEVNINYQDIQQYTTQYSQLIDLLIEQYNISFGKQLFNRVNELLATSHNYQKYLILSEQKRNMQEIKLQTNTDQLQSLKYKTRESLLQPKIIDLTKEKNTEENIQNYFINNKQQLANLAQSVFRIEYEIRTNKNSQSQQRIENQSLDKIKQQLSNLKNKNKILIGQIDFPARDQQSSSSNIEQLILTTGELKQLLKPFS